jgi:glycosyltransferase involved in cell wall biosynthesis
MRVCYVISTLRETGPTVQLLNIVDNLTGEIDPTVVTLSPESGNSLVGAFRDAGVSVTSLGLSRLKGVAYGGSELRKQVTALSPDIVHSHGIRADLLSALALRSYTTVSTLHNNPVLDYTHQYGQVKGRALAALHLLGLQFIDHPVGCSAYVADSVKRYGLSPTVIRNGIDADTYTPTEDTTSARTAVGLPRDRTIFVSVGAFLERKDPQTVVEGFLESRRTADSTLVMVGDGPERDACRTLADGHPSIVFPGFVETVRPYLTAADYFVSASLGEGLPVAVLEALACGLPVCLSDIDPHEEILEFHPSAGELFTPGDSSALASSINELTARDRSSASRMARKIVTEELNSERMAEEYLEHYRQI